ncbi:HlyD family secretion protein [Xanthomonas sacchari]
MDQHAPGKGEKISRGVFRRHALVASAEPKSYGTVLLLGDRFVGGMALAGMLVVALILLFLATFSTSRKVQWQGLVVPQGGTVAVIAPSAGSVSRILVNEGERVKAGQAMFMLSESLGNARLEGGDGAIPELLDERRQSLKREATERHRRAELLKSSMLERLADYDEEIRAASQQEQLQLQVIALAEQTSKTYSELESSRYVSGIAVREKRLDLLDKRQRLVDIRRQIQQLRRERISLDSDVQDQIAQSKLDSLDLQRKTFELDQQLTESTGTRTVVVRALGNGIVGTVNVASGQGVGPLSQLAVLIPEDRPLEVEMYAPSQAVGLMREGMDVSLRYSAFPYQKFGQQKGRVKEISLSTMRAEEIRLPESLMKSGAEPLYRVRVDIDSPTVKVYGTEVPLRPGMLVEGSVNLERRKLYEWILDPLFTVTGRL